MWSLQHPIVHTNPSPFSIQKRKIELRQRKKQLTLVNRVLSGPLDVKKYFANSLCPGSSVHSCPVKRIMFFSSSKLRFSTMHCFESPCNVYVKNLTLRQRFPDGHQILGQFIFTFFGRLKVRLLFPELLIAHKNLGTLYLPAQLCDIGILTVK